MINIHAQISANSEKQYFELAKIAKGLGFPNSDKSGTHVDINRKFYFKISNRNELFWLSNLDQGQFMEVISYEDFIEKYGDVKEKITIKDLETYIDLVDAIKDAEADVQEAQQNLKDLIADKEALGKKIGVDE